MSNRPKVNWHSVLYKTIGPRLLDAGFKRYATNHYVRVIGPVAHIIRFDTMQSLDPYWGGRVRPDFFVTSMPMLDLLKPFSKHANMKKFAWPYFDSRQFFQVCPLSKEELNEQYSAQPNSTAYWQFGQGEWYDFNLVEMGRAAIDFGDPYFLTVRSSYDVVSYGVDRAENGLFYPKKIYGHSSTKNCDPIGHWDGIMGLSSRNICLALCYLEGSLEHVDELLRELPAKDDEELAFEQAFVETYLRR